VATVTATIGIRGTGVYAEPIRSRLISHLLRADIGANADPNARNRGGEAPRRAGISGLPKDGKTIRPAPFINHTDQS
jgi:hypothetical protein